MFLLLDIEHERVFADYLLVWVVFEQFDCNGLRKVVYDERGCYDQNDDSPGGRVRSVRFK